MPISLIDERHTIDEGMWTISQLCFFPEDNSSGHAVLILESYVVTDEGGKHTIQWYDLVRQSDPDNPMNVEIRVCPGGDSKDYLVDDVEQIKEQYCQAKDLDIGEIDALGVDEVAIREWQRNEFFKARGWSRDKIDTWPVFEDSATKLPRYLRHDIKRAEDGEIQYQLRGGDGRTTFNCLTWVWKQLVKVETWIGQEAKERYEQRKGIMGRFAKVPSKIGQEKAEIRRLLYQAITNCCLGGVISVLDRGVDVDHDFQGRGYSGPFNGTPLLIALQVASGIVEKLPDLRRNQQEYQNLLEEQEEFKQTEQRSFDRCEKDAEALIPLEALIPQVHERLVGIRASNQECKKRLAELQRSIARVKREQRKIDKKVSKHDGIIAIIKRLISGGADLIINKVRYTATSSKNAIAILEDKLSDNEQIWAAIRQRSDLADICKWYIAVGQELKRQGRFSEEAIRYYKKAAELNPSAAFVWSNLGLIYRERGEHDEAIRSYEQALEVEPEDEDILRSLGLVYQQAGQEREAAEYYERADEAANCSIGLIGSVFSDVYRLDEACWAMSIIEDKAIILEKIEGGQRIAEYLYYDEVTHNVKRERSARTSRVALLEELKTKSLIQSENPLAAEVCSKKVTRMQVDNLLASSAISDSTTQEWAQSFFVNVSFSLADIYKRYVALGEEFKRQGRLDEAIRSYNAALKIEPDDEDILRCLGLVYQLSGKEQTAARYYDRADEAEDFSMGLIGSVFSDVCRLDEASWAMSIIEDEVIVLEMVEEGQKIIKHLYYDGAVKDVRKERLDVTSRVALLRELKIRRLIRLENPLRAKVCSKKVTMARIENLLISRATSDSTAQEWAQSFFANIDRFDGARPANPGAR
jgi:tetratricopeptide (TPR) repeat protein